MDFILLKQQPPDPHRKLLPRGFFATDIHNVP
jgi:hypothetical protein